MTDGSGNDEVVISKAELGKLLAGDNIIDTFVQAYEQGGKKKELLVDMLRETTKAQTIINQVAAPQPLYHGLTVTTSLSIPKFDNESDYPWEEFENNLLSQCEGKSESDKKTILRTSLGPHVRGWYTLQKRLMSLTFSEQIDAFRKNYSKRMEGREALPPPMLLQTSETVDQFATRLRRAFVHMTPLPVVDNPNWTEMERTLKSAMYEAEEKRLDSMMKEMFMRGLPDGWYKKLNVMKMPPKTLEEVIDITKRWERGEQLATEQALMNSQIRSTDINKRAALTYLSMKEEEDPIPEPCEGEHTMLATARILQKHKVKVPPKSAEQALAEQLAATQLAQEKRDKRRQEEHIAAMAGLEEKLTTFISHAMGDVLPKKLEKMMTRDSKPTAKAGTKGDPTVEQLQAKSRGLVCSRCEKLGHFAKECRARYPANWHPEEVQHSEGSEDEDDKVSDRKRKPFGKMAKKDDAESGGLKEHLKALTKTVETMAKSQGKMVKEQRATNVALSDLELVTADVDDEVAKN